MCASLLSVFHQLEAMAGMNGPPAEQIVFGRPTVAELEAHPIDSRDYECGERHTAESSLRRAHAQLKKGWLTQKEFDVIKENCLSVIAKTTDKG